MRKQLLLIVTLFMLSYAYSAAQVIDSSAQWTWMGGSPSAVNQKGVFGTPGAFAPGNIPGGRQSGVSWKDNDGNFWVFGGIGQPPGGSGGNGVLNDLWKFDTSLEQWALINGSTAAGQVAQPNIAGGIGVEDDTYRPAGRSNASTWVDTAGNLWLFGGNADGYLNDLWRYNTQTNRWAYMGGSLNKGEAGIYGAKGTPSTGNRPGGRYEMLAWADKDNNFWFFGGHGRVEGPLTTLYQLNELWKYNPANGEWTWVAGSKTGLEASVYGTTGVASAANLPGSRNGAQFTKDAEGNIWVFGGSGCASTTAVGKLNDLWKFYPATGEWAYMGGSQIHNKTGVYGTRGEAAPANMPGGRFGGWLFAGKDGGIWLFGGRGLVTHATNENRMNDLWKFDTTSREWAWMKGSNTSLAANQAPGAVPGTLGTPAPANTPSGKTTNVGWGDNDGNFWIFAGVPNSGIYNDFWRLAPVIATPAQPDNFIVSQPDVCKTETGVVYRINQVAGATSYEWTYTPSTGVTINGSDTSVTIDFAANAANGTLSVVAKNAGGASPSRDLIITVHDLPVVPAITGTPSVCVGGTTTLSNATSGGTWLSGNTGTATVNSTTGVVTGVAAGTVNISYRVINTSNCTTTVSVPVTVNALPVVNAITGTTNVCVNGTMTLSNTTSGGTWLSANTATATVNSTTGVVTGVATGTVNISYRVINAGNCTTTVSVPVTVNALPTVSSTNTGSQAVCDGDSLLLTASGTGGVSYQWKRGTTNVGTGATYQAKIAGTYTVTATVTGSSCSTTSTPATVLAVNSIPVASVTAGGATEVCSGETVTLTAAAVTGADYQWKQGTTPVGTNNNSYTAGITGAYKVVVTYTATGCSDSTAPVDVLVYDRPVASLMPGDTAFCDGGLVTLEVVSQDTGLTYRWKDGSATIPLASAHFLEITETGVYSVVTGRTQIPNCEDSTNEVTVTVYLLPVVDITWDGALFHATPGHTSYQWHTSGQNIPGATNSIYTPLSDGGYSVTVTDDNECSTTSPVYNVTLDVNDLASLNQQITVYPNPAGQLVYIASPVVVSVSLSSIDGKLLLQGDDVRQVDLGNFADGVYMLRIMDQNGVFIRHEKLIKSSR